jgi:hypothetical protein
MKSIGYAKFRSLFAVMLVALVGGAFFGFDRLYGEVSGIAKVREDARKFRAEAAPLKMSTRSLVPDLRHTYPTPYRPEGSALLPSVQPRLFRTSPDGTVSDGKVTEVTSAHVLFLGGSTTECNEVDELFRFPAMVESILRERGAGIQSTNGGVRGHTTLDAINSLLNRPDLSAAKTVVLMENINDRLLLAIREGYGAELSEAAPTTVAAVLEAASATVWSAWEYLAYRSNLLFFARSGDWFGGGHSTARGFVTERTLDDLPLPSKEAQSLYERNLKVFVGVVRALDKSPVLMTQPLGKRSPGQMMFNDIVRKVARGTGAHLIDLDLLLPEDRGWAYLGDHIHLSNRGSREVASLIAASLAPSFGVSYFAPPADTGLTSLSRLAELCPAPGDGGDTPSLPRIFQVLGDSGRYPSVSADGRWLLFQSRPGSLDRIRALRLSDSRLFDLSPASATVHERHPAFLDVVGDGFTIVFGHGTVGEQKGQERLMVRAWPSGATQPLLDDDALAGSIPTVIGRQVVFAGSRDLDGARAPNLYRFDRVRRTIERLTEANAEQWRPFGGTAGEIYFISDAGGRFAIYRRDASTGKSEKVIESSGDEWDPALSPDGRWLAFASKRNGNWDVYVAPTTDFARLRRVTSLPGDEWDPAWHPGGRVLLFGSAQESEPKIMALCAFGTPPLNP